jgi:hypothetical protein
VRLEPGEGGDPVAAHGDDEQPAAMPEAVGVVAGVDDLSQIDTASRKNLTAQANAAKIGA